MLEEIQNIKNRKIICLDFDDCLIPWKSHISPYKDFTLDEILEGVIKNSYIVKDFIEETGFEPFITSSWAKYLDDNLEFTNKDINEELVSLILKILKDKFSFIGKDPFNDRILAVEILLENKNKVIAIDDLDISHYFNDDNFRMVNVFNGIGLKEKLEEIKDWALKD